MQSGAVEFELSVSQFGALYGFLIYCLQVIYGGRVLDDFDRRILRTYMNEYMGDFLFDTFQSFHFYCDQSVDFVILNETDKDGYISK
jgi:dynein heavy chain